MGNPEQQQEPSGQQFAIFHVPGALIANRRITGESARGIPNRLQQRRRTLLSSGCSLDTESVRQSRADCPFRPRAPHLDCGVLSQIAVRWFL